MIKRIFIYIAALIGFVSCSDELFEAPGTDMPENGELSVSFAFPDMNVVTTRGISENSIGKVTMLMYDKKDGSLIAREDLDVDDDKAKITIPENYRKTGGLYFLFFANDMKSKTDFADGSDMDVAMKIFNSYYSVAAGGDQENLTMSGACTLKDLLELSPVCLYHNAAKVTVVPNDPASDMKFEYQVYGTAGNSMLMVGSYNSNVSNEAASYCASHTETDGFVDFGENGTHNTGTAANPCDTYVHPTLNNDGPDLNKSFVIVRSKCNVDENDENYYYYCLQFQREDDGVLNILPNHYYKFLINTEKGKIGKGYLSQEDALANPVPLSSGMYVVYDHSPRIYNIVTDGVRSLGVSDKLYHKGAAGDDCFFVKIFSKEQSDDNDEYAAFKDNFRNFIKFTENTWVELKSCERATEEDLGKAGYNDYTDKDNNYFSDGTGEEKVGVIYKITCQFKGSPAGSQTTTGTVTWKGLSRRFEVEWDRAFNSTDLYKSVVPAFTANSTYGATPAIGNDYFGWIAGKLNASGDDYETFPKVWGADSKSNNGDPRDRGLHFPMQGGGKMKYTLALKDELSGGGNYTWTYYYEGDELLRNNTTVTIDASQKNGNDNQTSKEISGVGPIFTIEWTGAETFDYGVANLVIRINKSEKAFEDHRIPLYHTGFFMPSGAGTGENKHYTGNGIGLAEELESGRDWTYYEVVTITRGNGKRYRILDRNLGAHSAEMYVEATGNTTYAGNQQAAGGYYRVALYNKGFAPEIDTDNLYSQIGAPKGFAIPQKEVFDDIRNSSSFSMASVGTYYTSHYAGDYYGPKDADGNRKRKYTYFPKARFLDTDNGKQGDSRAGYYWTSTASRGVEKEEVGAWLDCFTLSGSSSTYSRGEVYCSAASTSGNKVRTGEINGNAMSVRLILSEDNNVGETVHQTKFFVSGATHVYLYTLDSNGNRTALTNWPGYSICPSSQAAETDPSKRNKFNFLYESKINESKDLYVIFNFQTASGAIYSMSYNPADNRRARFTNTVSPKALIGFNLGGIGQKAYYNESGVLVSPAYDNGKAPDFNDYGSGTPVEVENGLTWSFTFNTSDNEASTGGIGESVPKETVYRIYIKPDGDQNNAFDAWIGSTGIVKALFSSDKFVYENGYYYHDFTHSGDSFELSWQLVYNAWEDNGTIATNNWDWCTICTTPGSDFSFDETTGRKCYTITSKTGGKSGKP